MYKFEKLTVWKESLVLSKDAYRISRNLPAYEQYSLSDQLRRAAVSVLLNIAEGSGSESDREFIRYLYIARKSLFEVVALLKFAETVYPNLKLKNIYLQTDTVGKLLNGLIRKLKASS